MLFIIQININERIFDYHIRALNKDEAFGKLLLRLPPNKREVVKIDSVRIDSKCLHKNAAYGAGHYQI